MNNEQEAYETDPRYQQSNAQIQYEAELAAEDNDLAAMLPDWARKLGYRLISHGLVVLIREGDDRPVAMFSAAVASPRVIETAILCDCEGER